VVCGLARATPSVRGVVRSVHSNFVYSGFLSSRRIFFSQVAAALGVVSVACGSEVADNEERRYHHRPLVIENWVDVAAFAGSLAEGAQTVRTELGLTQDDFVVMLLGNCEPVKGHSLLLDAVAAMHEPVVVLHVGGEERADEEERDRWERMVSGQRLIRLGRRDDVSTLLAAADLLAMPSEHEGFGLAAAESFCAGTPVLATDAPGLAWITDFRTGRSLHRSSAAWAAELGHAAERRKTPEWKTACREDAEVARRRFSPDRGVSEWLRIYERSMANGFDSGRLWRRSPKGERMREGSNARR
jgi:glycosyltransferase involved in cell wall biosynthesis